MKFGYMRVSTMNQNLDRQEQQLKDAGCQQISKSFLKRSQV
jgi:DNA invertase Pin-like site-specific DNA recombinase